MSLMKDVRTVFQYHGAEHKAVNCFDAGKKLTLSNVRASSRIHKRCGTNFLFLVILVSIFLYVFIPKSYGWGIMFLLRILALPLIAGISYELLKLGAKFEKNFILYLVVLPGLWMQRITTQEPDAKQLAVGIASLEAVLSKEAKIAH